MSTVSSSSALLLVHLRSVALATQAAAVLLAAGALGMQLPLAMDGLILGALACMNTLAWWYARRGAEPSAWILTAQLALDIVGLTAFLYFNGGYANPFASLFLLPLAVAATVLPIPHTAGLTALVVAGYSVVMFAYRPLPHYHGSLGDSFDLHLLGMWLSLVVAAVVIAGFVARLAATLRTREAHLAQLRESALRSEQLAALGALAAGTAHELGSPLSTMAVLVGELRAGAGADQRADLDLLSQQIDRCREVLTRNLTATGQGRAEGGGRQALDRWLTALVDGWQQTRPQSQLRRLVPRAARAAAGGCRRNPASGAVQPARQRRRCQRCGRFVRALGRPNRAGGSRRPRGGHPQRTGAAPGTAVRYRQAGRPGAGRVPGAGGDRTPGRSPCDCAARRRRNASPGVAAAGGPGGLR